MTIEIYTTLLTSLGAILLAGASYWFTKKRERDSELRKEKLEHYKEFVRSLSGIIDGESTDQAQREYALASNSLNLIAPQKVINAMRDFQEEIRVSNKNRSLKRHDELLSKLFYEIRRDLSIKPNDIESNFVVGLWSSGVPPKQN